MNESEKRIIEVIRKILEAGNNVEIKQNKDGSWKIYEVKKSIKNAG